ncbi:MAG: sigma factor, partial [Gammaproteobacteria bacterium]
MGANPEHWLDRLLAERGERLRSFLRRRARPGTEIADLSQEIYLRLLRVPEPEAIANPEAYLFTVAGNLLRERAV